MASAFDIPLSEDALARARKGERSGQEAIYRLFERAVYSIERRMTGDPDAAADIVQDTFLKAFQRLHQFRGDAPFGRWLRSIAASEALMHLRRGRYFLDLFTSDETAMETVGVEDVQDTDLERALSLLPRLPRSVLWLYHVEGYTHVEIAEMCGKTESFSKSQLSRAHQKLRTLLGTDGKPRKEDEPCQPGLARTN